MSALSGISTDQEIDQEIDQNIVPYNGLVFMAAPSGISTNR